jgi:hypothetical protein
MYGVDLDSRNESQQNVFPSTVVKGISQQSSANKILPEATRHVCGSGVTRIFAGAIGKLGAGR